MRILIIADQALFRQGLRVLLQVLRPSARLEELASVEQLLATSEHEPDLILVKLGCSGVARCAALPVLRQRYAAAVLVALSDVPDAALMREALAAGAAGYLPGTIDPSSSMQALQQVLDLGVYLPPMLLTAKPASAPELAPAERRLLQLLLQGLPEPVQMARLGRSLAGLRTDISALWARLGVSDRVQALYLLAAQGWPGLPRWHEELAHGD